MGEKRFSNVFQGIINNCSFNAATSYDEMLLKSLWECPNDVVKAVLFLKERFGILLKICKKNRMINFSDEDVFMDSFLSISAMDQFNPYQ